MKLFTLNRTLVAASIGLACVGATSRVWAGIEDYEFQLVQNEVKQGNAAEVAVRLIDKRSGKSVPDAVIFAQRVDMAPDGMEMMAAPIEPLPSTEPGIYRFKAQIQMAGGWRLSLGAKVQGETGSLESKLEFKAVP
ncbi:FixH family protein [Mesorhizobium sp. M7A.F.Ca.US.008.03.1.1]|uniref:FixH family protein n=1 Tax=Mesorhizobium sp. M7A.F.Ca.US.008.03.1.1 TaxID=2496742 RepID=UPI000FCC3763|nr:FixH family protein [Mesorhizobium sp. M7A.F.Ca.US.008.03.1.1]RUW60703.1 heavy metal RND transporter [Mesorhizobium sp. M7A.F.Ca.US.008.03.1.1]